MENRKPERTCCACRSVKAKESLIRIVRLPEGGTAVDVKAKENGRGAYICRSEDCLKKAIKCRSIERSLGASVSTETYEALQKEIAG